MADWEQLRDMSTKLILVIGGTGAQGIVVIDALFAPTDDGAPSPYRVCVLTRDPSSNRAKKLAARGAECVEGTTASIAAAFC